MLLVFRQGIVDIENAEKTKEKLQKSDKDKRRNEAKAQKQQTKEELNRPVVDRVANEYTKRVEAVDINKLKPVQVAIDEPIVISNLEWSKDISSCISAHAERFEAFKPSFMRSERRRKFGHGAKRITDEPGIALYSSLQQRYYQPRFDSEGKDAFHCCF